jgi:hypothetical protein
MNEILIADILDLLISLAGGVLLTLFGYRIIGRSEQLDKFNLKWGKLMRWLGPLTIFLSILNFVINMI